MVERNEDKEPIEFDEFLAETEDAFGVVIDGENFWFPKSRCTIYLKNKKIHAPQWLLENKGLV